MNALVESDIAIFWWIHNLSGSSLDYPIALIAYATRTIQLLMISTLLIFIFAKHNKYRYLLAFILPVFFIDILVGILKNLIARPRPFDALGEAVHVVDFFGIPSTYSFPSGHATIAFAATAILVGIFGVKLRPLYLVACLIAISRVYLGVHYPSDVLAGSLLGWFLATFFMLAATHLKSSQD